MKLIFNVEYLRIKASDELVDTESSTNYFFGFIM